MTFRGKRFCAGVVGMFLLVGIVAEAATPQLQAVERNQLRFRLENLANEVELLIRNRSVNASDLQRQEKEAEMLKVYDRIPFTADFPGLEKELSRTAARFGLKVQTFRRLKKVPLGRSIPRRMFSDDPRLEFKVDQVVEEIPFEITLSGDHLAQTAIKSWTESWQEDQLRLVEPEGGYGRAVITPAESRGHWKVRAHAFRFRNFAPPVISLRDPMTVLPAWARKDPAGFAKAEPTLWESVRRAKELAPKAQAEYEVRSRFIVNHSRSSFFFSKAIPRSNHR